MSAVFQTGLALGIKARRKVTLSCLYSDAVVLLLLYLGQHNNASTSVSPNTEWYWALQVCLCGIILSLQKPWPTLSYLSIFLAPGLLSHS